MSTSASSSISTTSPTLHWRSPIRLVLFDVFDTLCTPRIPIHEQYAEEAQKVGLKVTPDLVRASFKPAFKEMSTRYPLYGKLSNPPISPEQWWTLLIGQCMIYAGVTESELEMVIKPLSMALLSRFESDVGYRNFDDTLECLTTLRSLNIKTSIVSNADPRILSTLSSLSILPLLSHPPTLSWGLEKSKPSLEIFEAACASCGEEIGQGVLMIGDELEADFKGALEAGIEGRLVRRPGEWSDGAIREAEEDLGGVHVIRNFGELIHEVKARGTSAGQL